MNVATAIAQRRPLFVTSTRLVAMRRPALSTCAVAVMSPSTTFRRKLIFKSIVPSMTLAEFGIERPMAGPLAVGERADQSAVRPPVALMEVPVELVPAVRELIARSVTHVPGPYPPAAKHAAAVRHEALRTERW
jgi:hypothetical protein